MVHKKHEYIYIYIHSFKQHIHIRFFTKSFVLSSLQIDLKLFLKAHFLSFSLYLKLNTYIYICAHIKLLISLSFFLSLSSQISAL